MIRGRFMRLTGKAPSWLALCILAMLPAATLAGKSAPRSESIEFFEKKVRPVLIAHCFKCHSVKAKKLKGELLLDSQAGLLKGGEGGPVVIPRHPEKSRLIEALHYKNVDMQMPPK